MKSNESAVYVTTYCNHAHRMVDGKPIAHECFVLPTAMLVAEREGNHERALEVIGQWKRRKVHNGLKG